jgi:hypothetical protein
VTRWPDLTPEELSGLTPEQVSQFITLNYPGRQYVIMRGPRDPLVAALWDEYLDAEGWPARGSISMAGSSWT